jgi:hypothetical protein
MRCGGVVAPGSSFCEDCGAPVDAGREASDDPSTAGVTVPAPRTDAAVTPSADGLPVVLPGSPIRLGHGEVIWRQYRAVRLRSRQQGQGTLYVTDARVVFYAWARGRGTQRGSALIQQVKLEDISGFSAYVSRSVSFLLLLFAGVFSLATVVALLSGALPLALILAILAGICIAALFTDAAQRGNAGVTIHARQAETSPVVFGGLGTRHALLEALFGVVLFLIFPPLLLLRIVLRSYTAWDVIRGRPGDDSDLVIAELGALIMDLQTRGTFAAAHYGVQQDEDLSQAPGVS